MIRKKLNIAKKSKSCITQHWWNVNDKIFTLKLFIHLKMRTRRIFPTLTGRKIIHRVLVHFAYSSQTFLTLMTRPTARMMAFRKEQRSYIYIRTWLYTFFIVDLSSIPYAPWALNDLGSTVPRFRINVGTVDKLTLFSTINSTRIENNIGSGYGSYAYSVWLADNTSSTRYNHMDS